MKGSDGRPRSEIESRLDRLFERVARMSDAELLILRAVWETQDELKRTVAWRQVKRIVRSHHREDLLEWARSRLAAWVNNYMAFSAVEYGNLLINPTSGMSAVDVRKAALPPLMDAVAAELAGDALEAAEVALLVEPLTQLAARSSAHT